MLFKVPECKSYVNRKCTLNLILIQNCFKVSKCVFQIKVKAKAPIFVGKFVLHDFKKPGLKTNFCLKISL